MLAVLALLGLGDNVGDVRTALGFRDGEAGALLAAEESGHDPLPEFVRAEMEDRTDADAEAAEEAVQDPTAAAARELTFSPRAPEKKGVGWGFGSDQSQHHPSPALLRVRRIHVRARLTRSR